MANSQKRTRTTQQSKDDDIRIRETTDWVADYGRDFLAYYISDYDADNDIPTATISSTSQTSTNGSTNGNASTTPASTTTTPSTGQGNRSSHSTQDYAWQEEVALLNMPYPMGASAQLQQHNTWLTANGYGYQRAGMAVWQHVKKLRKDGADTNLLTQEQKSWKQIQAERRKAAKAGVQGQ